MSLNSKLSNQLLARPDLIDKVSKTLQYQSFPLGIDQEIKQLMIEYLETHKVMYELGGMKSNFQISHAAQEGFTVTNTSIVFRILTNYKGKKGQIAINFPNWRGWEEVLPLGAKNHFKVGNSRNEPKKYGRYQHGYYHSFKFNNKKEFIQFFKQYVEAFPVYK